VVQVVQVVQVTSGGSGAPGSFWFSSQVCCPNRRRVLHGEVIAKADNHKKPFAFFVRHSFF